MTARDTYNASVVSANTAVVATGISNAVAEQETINAKGVNVGYTTQTGTFANLDSATKTANALRLSNAFAREKAKQSSIAAARDTLRNAGDYGPF
jgi:hypothetical protein